ncbi:DUF4265 domain-containing protein [Kitasatospora sp. NA04385]|uniref:DUF4265 domain-containing protein n=1 Tax=Kitasatospora sp. NA04385 TaxID=2742135 RepID=UPI0026DF235A|nr:DUF4265 domain-containing protein [Kitasatospora sp. NA04385]
MLCRDVGGGPLGAGAAQAATVRAGATRRHVSGETVQASENCTIRLIVLKDGGSADRVGDLPPAWRDRRGIEQFGMVALDVPPEADIQRIRTLLEHGDAKGWWHWEEGCVTAAWEASAGAEDD